MKQSSLHTQLIRLNEDAENYDRADMPVPADLLAEIARIHALLEQAQS